MSVTNGNLKALGITLPSVVAILLNVAYLKKNKFITIV